MPHDLPRRPTFPTTRITLIHAARTGVGAQAEEALAVLCRAYWYPIYTYVRRIGYSPEESEDLTQGFFTRVLEKHYLRGFQRERGRFRSFLLTALKHFIANERDWAHAQKRGGAHPHLPLAWPALRAATPSSLATMTRPNASSSVSGQSRS